jgi:hypothetical protein
MLGLSTAVYGGKCHRYCRALLVLLTLLYATTVNPEVLEAVPLSLFSTKLNLFIPSLTTFYAISQILKTDFLVIRLPGMRKNGIARNTATDISYQAEGAVGVDLQKAHW